MTFLDYLSYTDLRITTYEEVRKSYPVYNPPGGITDDAEIEQGWIDTYDRYRGPLHRIKFRRILLDGKYNIHFCLVDLVATNSYI